MLRRAKPLLGTLVEVACEGADRAGELAASQAAFDAVERVHQLMSRHEPGSELSTINALAPGIWAQAATETMAVFDFARRLSEQSSGVFDVFAAHSDSVQGGGWRDLEIDPSQQRLRKHAVMQADLGGIAKGYAVDAAVNALRAAGAGSGWVNAGGDLRVFGPLALPLEVRAPWNPGHTITCTMLCNQAAATSASYWLATPVLRHGLTRKTIDLQASWTVCAPVCMAADALTKLVAATGDALHPVLALHQARAWVYAGAGDHGAEPSQHAAQ